MTKKKIPRRYISYRLWVDVRLTKGRTPAQMNPVTPDPCKSGAPCFHSLANAVDQYATRAQRVSEGCLECAQLLHEKLHSKGQQCWTTIKIHCYFPLALFHWKPGLYECRGRRAEGVFFCIFFFCLHFLIPLGLALFSEWAFPPLHNARVVFRYPHYQPPMYDVIVGLLKGVNCVWNWWFWSCSMSWDFGHCPMSSDFGHSLWLKFSSNQSWRFQATYHYIFKRDKFRTTEHRGWNRIAGS